MIPGVPSIYCDKKVIYALYMHVHTNDEVISQSKWHFVIVCLCAGLSPLWHFVLVPIRFYDVTIFLLLRKFLLC